MAAQTSHPVLHYFDVAARGELSKLIAAVGGVEMTIKKYAPQIEEVINVS